VPILVSGVLGALDLSASIEAAFVVLLRALVIIIIVIGCK